MLIILKKMLIILLICTPSLLSIPSKSREHGGIILLEDHKEYRCILSALWNESRGEPEHGMRAVMSVIYNRTKAKGFPSSYCDVILQPKQFSAFNNRNIQDVLKPIEPLDREAYGKVALIAKEAVLGTFKPVLEEDVLHYAHVKIKNKWTRKFERVKVIHQHVFYKEI